MAVDKFSGCHAGRKVSAGADEHTENVPGQGGFACRAYGKSTASTEGLGGRLGEPSLPHHTAASPVMTAPPTTLTFSKIALAILSASSGFSFSASLAASRP